MKLLLPLSYCILFILSAKAQPFVCDGSLYLTLTNSGPSTFYQVALNPITGTVLFDPLPGGDIGSRINGIGYRSTDNYIYGLGTNTRLLRVDASQNTEVVADLSSVLTPDYGYFCGAITPDGQFLVLLGSGGNPQVSRELVHVNLDTYEVEITLIPNAEEVRVFCGDIGIDPRDGTLYSFDFLDNRLLIIDENTGFVDATTYPPTALCDDLGAIFFDAFGVMYGYGKTVSGDISETLFRFDKVIGEAIILGVGPQANSKDGCACPYNLELQKRVFPEEVLPCAEVTYTFTIVNASLFEEEAIDFTDIMPAELTITEIVEHPFGGTIVSGVGGNELIITGMTVPRGVDSIVVRTEVAPDALGIYNNQALLSNLRVGLGTSVSSDNPKTLIDGDSTALSVISLATNIPQSSAELCPGGVLTLDVTTPGASYWWADGSTESTLEVSEAGWYTVQLTSNCDTIVDSIFVEEVDLLLDLGPDISLELGDSVWLRPVVFNADSVRYVWNDPLQNSLRCATCATTYARPFFDVVYQLTVEDSRGCSVSDELVVRVKKDRLVYIPNVFSPNFDGTNDVFYLQGKGNVKINHLQVYNRWGALVFEDKGGLINDATFGWDGTFKGKEVANGVYVYRAFVAFIDGHEEVLVGSITLVK